MIESRKTTSCLVRVRVRVRVRVTVTVTLTLTLTLALTLTLTRSASARGAWRTSRALSTSSARQSISSSQLDTRSAPLGPTAPRPCSAPRTHTHAKPRCCRSVDVPG